MPHARSSSSALPKHWPPDIIYLTSLHIPPPLPPSVLEFPAASTSSHQQQHPPSQLTVVSTAPATPSPLVRITAITNPSHPAYPEYGLYANRALPPSSFILFYLGTLHDTASTDPDSNYDLSLDRELDLSIDARTRGNEARFINDYRGIRAEGPNAEFRDCLVEGTKGRKPERRIGVFVLSAGSKAGGKRAKGIAKGEEIVVSYGKGFWHARKEEEVD